MERYIDRYILLFDGDDDDDGDVQTVSCSRLWLRKIHPVENAKYSKILHSVLV